MRAITSLVLTLALAVAACGGGTKKETKTGGEGDQTAADEKSLFDRLGGLPAITKVVEDFVTIVGADDRINHYFANSDLTKVKALLVEQICGATGGGCEYTGRNMAETHAGMNLTEADFGALVEDLVKALDANNVPEREKGELLAPLAAMHDDIVGK
jgi:hemoglobin